MAVELSETKVIIERKDATLYRRSRVCTAIALRSTLVRQLHSVDMVKANTDCSQVHSSSGWETAWQVTSLA